MPGSTPAQTVETRPTMNLADYRTVYPNAAKGHPSNQLIGISWGDHFYNWQHVANGEFDNLAGTFDAAQGQFQAAKQNVQSTRATLAGMQGKLADHANGMLDDLENKIDSRLQANAGAAPAIRNFVSANTATHNQIEGQWAQWWKNRANLNACHANEQAMTQGVESANGQMMDLFNTLQNVGASSLTTPTIDNAAIAPPAQPTITGHSPAVPTVHPAVAAHMPGLAVAPAHPTATIPGAHHPGTVAAAQPTQVPGTIGSGSMAAHHTGSSVLPSQTGPTGTTPANNVPTLASSGAATLAPPPGPTVATASGAPMTAPMAAPVSTAGVAGTGFGGVPLVPFAGAPGTGAPGVGGGTRRSDDDQESRKNRAGGLLPVSPATAGGRRPGATVRPGVAKRTGSTEAAAVAGGLRGRTDASTDRSADPAQRRATRSRRARGEESATVQFLDEDAWQIEDAGSGIVAANQPPSPGAD